MLLQLSVSTVGRICFHTPRRIIADSLADPVLLQKAMTSSSSRKEQKWECSIVSEVGRRLAEAWLLPPAGCPGTFFQAIPMSRKLAWRRWLGR